MKEILDFLMHMLIILLQKEDASEHVARWLTVQRNVNMANIYFIVYFSYIHLLVFLWHPSVFVWTYDRVFLTYLCVHVGCFLIITAANRFSGRRYIHIVNRERLATAYFLVTELQPRRAMVKCFLVLERPDRTTSRARSFRVLQREMEEMKRKCASEGETKRVEECV